MKQVWQNIVDLWRRKTAFQMAAGYLILLLLLVLVLPWLPLPYGPDKLDYAHTFQPPFEPATAPDEARHLLGTDGLGRDVFSNMLYGARTALLISVPVMLLATLLGLILGAGAGFYADRGFTMHRSSLLVLVLGIICFCYYGLYLPIQITRLGLGATALAASLITGILLLMLLSGFFVLLHKRVTFFRKRLAVPVDQIVLRLIEGLSTIPRFVLILVLASFLPPSVVLLSLILVLTIWTNVARLARAEMLRIKQLPYFEAAKSIGLRANQLLLRHALPNLAGPVLVAFTFGLGGLLALESTLSFLSIGVPTTLVSWGRMIANIRSNTSAWWLVVFPGGFLSLTVLAFYTCSHYLTQSFSKNSKG
ncbi:ABC transporter permease [Pontibacter diazotrophicus]|uniref:ABC transporter permease n=1 Tax=Pontibacter diazotrophicus TaxID=1400979 RepID=A0A3D8LAD2_9BACT|nr:ABC transporter permease [Pontibacter diazotrophicus]RDV14276.1 ABC transporter permease [Pontibacter diazotrophicus]